MLFLALITSAAMSCSSPTPGPPADPFGLASMPEIAGVSVLLESPEPRLTVVHLADWHFVPREVFAADERTHDPAVTDEQIEERYAAFLDEVEAVQSQQRTVFIRLAKERGLRVGYVEALTDGFVAPYRERAKAVAAVSSDVLADAIERAERDGDSFRYGFARPAFDEHRDDRLATGAAGKLWAEGLLAEVLPAEDAAAYAAANPVREGGAVAWDEAATARRELAIAQRLLATKEPLVAIALGGRHDLTDELDEAGDVRLIRVEVRAWRDVIASR